MLSKEEFQHLKKLARISLSDKEEEDFFENFCCVLKSINVLQEIDTSGVEPSSHAIPNMTMPLREDIPQRLLSQQEFLQEAPETFACFIKVPPIMDHQDN